MNNFKLTLMLATLFVLAGCGGAEERKEVYLEKAKLFLESGNLDKARIELKNVLQIDPKDAEARFQLGEIFDQKKEYQKAFNSYSKAIELDPDNLKYHAKLGTYFLVLAGDIDAAIEKRDFILSKDPINISGLLLNAGILFRQGEVDGAKKIAQDIFSKKPEHMQNALFLSSLYFSENKYDESIDVLKSCIEKNPEDRLLVSSLAKTYFKAGRNDLAENEYKKILKMDPDEFSNHLKLVLFYKEMGALNKAENVLRKAVEEDADSVNRKIALVNVIQENRGNQVAIKELNNLVLKNKEMGGLRLSLAKLYLSEKNQSAAEKVLEAAASDFSEDAVGMKSRVYLANLYMNRNDIEAATRVIDDALEMSPNDSDVNFVKAKLHLFNKNYEGAIISLRIVVKDNPENIDAYLLLSAAYKENGEDVQVAETIARAYENNRTNAKALLALAKYHAESGNKSELEKILDNYLAIDANNYEALSYKSALLNERKMFSEAKVYAERMVELHSDKPNGYIQSVPYMLAENRKKEAVNLLEAGYSKVSDKDILLKPLVELCASLKKFDVAISHIQDAIRENAETAELYMLLAKVQIASGKTVDARASLIKAGLKGDLMLSLEMAKLYEGLGDYNASINEYEKVYEKHPDSVVLINNLAVLLSSYRNDENSLKRAKTLADRLKSVDQAVTLDTVGWVYYKIGDYSEAVNVLNDVVEKAPDTPVFNYHLGMAMYKLGDKSGAKVHLARSLANNSVFSGKEEAEVYLQKLQ
ncbi:tetratricopeptide repeat protein [Pseudomonadota bacterium]